MDIFFPVMLCSLNWLDGSVCVKLFFMVKCTSSLVHPCNWYCVFVSSGQWTEAHELISDCSTCANVQDNIGKYIDMQMVMTLAITSAFPEL